MIVIVVLITHGGREGEVIYAGDADRARCLMGTSLDVHRLQ